MHDADQQPVGGGIFGYSLVVVCVTHDLYRSSLDPSNSADEVQTLHETCCFLNCSPFWPLDTAPRLSSAVWPFLKGL